MRRLALTLVLALVVVLAAALTASATVKRLSLISPVTAGGTVALTVNVAPRARCTITISTGTAVPTSRLGRKMGGRITWRWRLQVNAPPGRSPIVVKCGKSGVLRTKLTILAAEPELPLAGAAKRVCDQAPPRVMAKYETYLIPLLDRTLVQLRDQYGQIDCAYGANYDREHLSYYYLLSVKHGSSRCMFVVNARVIWINGSPHEGYTGPVDETYTETCTSLRG
jgi:hypothetical protein